MYNSYGYKWRKPQPRKRKKGKNFPSLRFARVGAEIMRDKTREIIQGRLLLHDLSPDGVVLFAAEALRKDEVISLAIDGPKRMFIRGTVTQCILFTLTTRILSTENFYYRAAIRFHFESTEERESLVKYCEELSLKD